MVQFIAVAGANTQCPFCPLPEANLLSRNNPAIAFRDANPVALWHTLVIPVRKVPSLFDTTSEERESMLELIEGAKKQRQLEFGPAGNSIGINDGAAAGQTVGHLQANLIRRYRGDRPDPRGCIRWANSEKADDQTDPT